MKGARKSIVFMARGDHYRKGYDVALDVFKSIDAGTSENIELWVCGSEMSEHTFPFPVRNFGVVSDDRLRQILSSADIFFYPSRHEGFGLFPLEAMSCGCIPVTTMAIPYATRSDVIFASPVGDVPDMVAQVKLLLNCSETTMNDMKQHAIQFAAGYDLKDSRILFEQTLLKMSGGGDA
jgi:glycosyltransferase involved in cell wall biosynthesis